MSEEFTNQFDGGVDINSPEFNESGKNTVKAISSASQALQIATKLANNDEERDRRRARVLSAFNGASPFNDSELIALAQGYRSNVSFGFAEGAIGRGVVPYNELTLNINDLTEIEANLPDQKLKICQVEFGKIMDKWGKWPKFISRLNQDLVLNGYNTAIFPSDYDPFPIFIQQKDGFADEGSPNDVNDLEVFVWKKSYLINELYAKISDSDSAKKAGWNVDNVRNALTLAMPESIYNQGSTTSGMWTAVESAIRDGALFVSIVGAKKVNAFHVFACELSGKVTHYIVLDGINVAGDTEQTGVELFKKEDRFDSMRDFLVYFDLETGDGTWHGSRGLGQRVFNTHKSVDKLRNSVIDQAFVSGLTLIQPGDQVQQEEMQLTVLGPFAVIPNGITISPQVLPAVANTTFQVDALLAATSEQRIGDIVPQAQSQVSGGDKTATEARITAGRQELITKGNLKRYIDPISQVISIIVRRLLKKNSPNPFAKEFQRELIRHGLKEDDLKEIRGARNTGKIDDILGNTAQKTQIIFGEFRGDPEVDQQRLKFKRIASVLDADSADELLISDKDQTKQIEAARLQELELTTIQTGMPVPVSPRDNHEIHLQVLLGWIGQSVQGQAQNFTPEILPILKLAVKHGTEHLKFLSQDEAKKSILRDLEERVKLSADAIKTLEKQKIDLAKAHFDQAEKLAKTPEEMTQVQQAKEQLQAQEESV